MRLVIALALGLTLGFAAPLYAADSHEGAQAPDAEAPVDVATPPDQAADEMAPAEGEEEPAESGSEEAEPESKPE